MNMKHIVSALASVLFSFFITQATLASDHAPYGMCLVAKCSEGFSLDTKNCRCVSDNERNPHCRDVIRCKPGSELDPVTCRCTKGNLFEKADSPKPVILPKTGPSEPVSNDPTPPKPKDPPSAPTIPCPPQRLCYP